MYLFRDEPREALGPGLATGAAVVGFLLGYWSALQAGANFAIVVVNFFLSLPILMGGIGAIIYFRDSVPRWAGTAVLANLLWFLAYPVRHSVAERARETVEFGDQAWLDYLDAQIVEWSVFVALLVLAVILFRRRC